MEIYKKIIGFEDYEVSNYGNVKSLKKNKEGNLLKTYLSQKGYYRTNVQNNNKSHTITIHQLVAITFLDHKLCGMKLVVNHKDGNRINNHVDNLEIVTNRINCHNRKIKLTSKYIGVSWDKNRELWVSFIRIKGKSTYLGGFLNEIDASNAYIEALNLI